MAHLKLEIITEDGPIEMDGYKDLIISGTSPESHSSEGTDRFKYYTLGSGSCELPLNERNAFSLYRNLNERNQDTWSKLWQAFMDRKDIGFSFSFSLKEGTDALMKLEGVRVHIISWGLRTSRIEELLSGQVNLVGKFYDQHKTDQSPKIYEYIIVSPQNLTLVNTPQKGDAQPVNN